MKIGLVRRGYSSTGGAENYLCRLADALEAAGHEPVLFAGPEWPRERWPVSRPLIAVAGSGPRAFADALATLPPERHCDRLFSLERVWRCDCYRAGDGVHRAWLDRRAAIEPAWRARLRAWNPKHRQILALEEALFARGGARTIIANSQLVRGEILERYGGSPERVQVVYNGLPSASFESAAPGVRESTRAAWQVGPDDYAVLFAGTGWERKGLAEAIAAVGGLPAAPRPHLIVAGRGNPRSYLKRAGQPAAGRVRFLGQVSDMRAGYAAADVFIAPTVYDPFSNACLEALAAGLPVLTTAANGFSEIMTAGCDGEIVDRTDIEALAAALRAWADPERRRETRRARTGRAAAFTIEANVASTLEILLGRA